jgi:hypothetical protein
MPLVRNALIDGCRRELPQPATRRSAAGSARNLAICAIMGSRVGKGLVEHWEGRTWGFCTLEQGRAEMTEL